ncbi:sulfite exporter TauE/SafE family protein [Carboxylicivirga mesophila]|uniref:Sulfite exporter TauE/SafE family protein n=1 Tax=Carboxylicivirga mesophila TaxID=1166478 RepID=A0ABS5KBC1_9BACT|nr:sulfite exporter TauE/SafE family protein [Carboxylicivirga mesophila]MBS2212315.1 sulfite exporter TauE/SafE family protein [Carboxylicivirga mesophila]
MYIIEGFIFGFLGSLHCVGMCGPLALALPLPTSSATKKALGAIFYNSGRAFTYGLLGLIFGLLGAGLKLSGIQQWVSIACGVLMILSVVLPGVIKMPKSTNKVSTSIYSTLKKKIGDSLNRKRLSNLLIIGVLNGFLPCGLVYVAISRAVTSDTITDSVLFMVFFGLGTLPLMFAIAYFANIIKSRFLHKLRMAIPIFIVILGILFILRGMNLGIPYISPKFQEKTTEVKCCH